MKTIEIQISNENLQYLEIIQANKEHETLNETIRFLISGHKGINQIVRDMDHFHSFEQQQIIDLLKIFLE